MSQAIRDREPRRREGLAVATELKKWATRPSDRLYTDLMIGRLTDAKTYADVNRIACIMEKRLHDQTMKKLGQNL